MNIEKILIYTFIMALITYLIRMLPLTLFRKKIKNPYIKAFLSYVPYAVLGAMTFPDVLNSTGNTISAFCGLLTAILLAYMEKGLLVVSMSACAVVFMVEKIQLFI